MKLTLLSAIPCSRVDLMRCCKDGRGGWVYSQTDPSRCFTKLGEGNRLFFSLSVFASPPINPDDFVEETTLVAQMNHEKIGTSTLEWKGAVQAWGIDLGDGSIFSWAQNLPITPSSNGLITVRIRLKLQSQADAIETTHPAYCHVREEDRDDMQLPRWKWLLSRVKRERRIFR